MQERPLKNIDSCTCILRYLLPVLFLMLFTRTAAAQDPDSLFRQAQQLAADRSYDEAILITDSLVSRYPENLDYAVYRGRIYSWKGDYPQAIRLLSGLYENNTGSYDILEALVNAVFWAENTGLTVLYADRGISDFPEHIVFFLNKKAVALEMEGKDDLALASLDEILVREPSNQDALYLRTLISRKKKNVLTFSYQNTSFSPGMAPWHLGYLEYKRNFLRSPVVARVSYGDVYSRTGLLYEADAYPKLNTRSYLYLNAGISSGEDIFPKVRAGGEYYRSFHKKAEASLGARYLMFETEEVTMLTGHVSYQFRQWNSAYRPFLAFIGGNSYLSNGVSAKRLNETTEQYLQLDLQYGIVPYTFFFASEIQRTGTFRAGIQYQWRLAQHFFIRPFLLYEYEEYVPGEFRNRFNVQLTLSRRF